MRNPPEQTIELRVHGIGGSTPEALLGVAGGRETVRVAGGGPTSFHARRREPGVEGYVWGRLTTLSPLQPLWLLLLPFTLLNMAGWMRQPAAPGGFGRAWAALHRLCVRLLGLALTALAVAWVSLLLIDLTAWQWGRAWADRLPGWLDWLALPGVRIGLGSAVVLIGVVVAAVSANRSQAGFERVKGPDAGREPDPDAGAGAGPGQGPVSPLEAPDFWEDSRSRGLLPVHAGVAAVTWAAATLLALAWGLKPQGPPQALELGRLVALLGSFQAALLLILLVLDLVGIAARPRNGGAHRWPRLRDGFRFAAPAVVATLGAAVANAGGAGIAQFLDGALDLTVAGEAVHARSELALLDVGGLTMVVMAVTAILVALWHLPASERAVNALCADEGYVLNREDPAHPVRGLPAGAGGKDDRDLRFAKKVVRKRRLADLGRNLDLLLTVPILLLLVVTPMAVAARFQPAAGLYPVPLPSFDATANGIPLLPMGAEAWLRGLAAWALVTGAGIAIGVVRVMLTQQSGRRMLGFFWDVLTFWPRDFHPLAVRPYAERAVPELQHRIAYHLDREPAPSAVLLSTHSQGTVLAAAALLARPGLGRHVGLITMGSPLAQLYARFFPAYFGVADQFGRLRRRLAGGNPAAGDRAWSSFFHRTDYVGKEVFGDGSDIELDDPARHAAPDVPVADPGPDPPRDTWTEIVMHGAYWREGSVQARARELRELLTAPGRAGRPATVDQDAGNPDAGTGQPGPAAPAAAPAGAPAPAPAAERGAAVIDLSEPASGGPGERTE